MNQNNVIDFNTGKPSNQPRVTIDQTDEVKCDSCQSSVFTEGVFMRRVSPLLTGQPKVSYIPVPTFVCAKCGHCNEEFIPNELKSKIVL